MPASERAASMGSVIRYRILIDARLTSRLARNVDAVAMEPQGSGMALVVDVADAAKLDALLQRLGDLGLRIVSLEQEAQPA
jgi:ABC-type branched-subunit amino acid transport system substrate-binding protein